jgi:hypothetical protein
MQKTNYLTEPQPQQSRSLWDVVTGGKDIPFTIGFDKETKTALFVTAGILGVSAIICALISKSKKQ